MKINLDYQPYARAQLAIAELKSAVLQLLHDYPEGLRNVDIGKALGIYAGHERHEGHISRTLLAIMQNEGVVVQDETTKVWQAVKFLPEETASGQ